LGDADNDNDNPLNSDAENAPGLQKLHMGLKPLPLPEDGDTSDDEGEIKDNLPYGADKEVNGTMINMMVELGDHDERDVEWLLAKEWKIIKARKKGVVSSQDANVRALTMQSEKRKTHYHGPNVASKLAQTQQQPQHVHNQTRLTDHMFMKSSSRSPHLHSPALSRAMSTVLLVVSSCAPSVASSCVPSVASSCTPSIPPSLEPSSDSPSSEDSSHASPVLQALDSPQDDEGTHSEAEKDDINDMLDAIGSEPKAKDEVCGWEELREQIKDDQRKGHREHRSLTHMNQLAILRNFAMLCIKRLGCIAASEEIAWQWHEGRGIHFACRI